MSNPILTLAFSANAFFAFSSNSFFKMRLELRFTLSGEHITDFVSDSLFYVNTIPFLSLGDDAFHAILVLYLIFFSLSSLSLSIFLLEIDLLTGLCLVASSIGVDTFLGVPAIIFSYKSL